MIFFISAWSIWPSALAALIIALSSVFSASGPVIALTSDSVTCGAVARRSRRARRPRGLGGALQRADREGAEDRHRAAARRPAEAAAEDGAGERADAADLRARERADLVLAEEVARLVGEAAGALLQPRGVDAGLAERAGDLAEDLIEPAAALAEAVGGALQPVLRAGLSGQALLHDLSENVAETHGFPPVSPAGRPPRGAGALERQRVAESRPARQAIREVGSGHPLTRAHIGKPREGGLEYPTPALAQH